MLDKISQTSGMRQVAGTIPIHHRYTMGVAGGAVLPRPARRAPAAGCALRPLRRGAPAAQDVL